MAMDEQGLVFLLLLPTFLVMVIVSMLLWKPKGALRTPPGPRGLPIIGHLHMLGSLPHQSLYNLSKVYGPLISLHLGSLPLVVASSPDMAKAILHTHDLSFADRPRTTITLMFTHGSDIIFALPDQRWRFKRRLCATELFSNKRLQSLKWMRESEVGALLRSFLPTNEGESYSNVLRPKLIDASSNIISTMLMSKRLSEDSRVEGIIHLLNEGVEVLAKFNVGDYIPYLGWMNFLQGNTKHGNVISTKLRILLQAFIDERRLAMKKVGFEDNHDLLQVMLGASSESMEMSDNDIKGVLMNLFTAGIDTTAYTIEWALATLLCNADKMKRLQHELDEVIGKERRVREDDIPKLPYLQAVVKEVMRLYPVAPLMLPHVAMERCEVANYQIDAGTQVFVNVWALGRDPTWWERPLEFMPDRFLKSNLDLRGQHFQFLPFGSGRRSCPGLSLGLLSVQTVLASLIHGFEWYVPSEPDMSEKFSLIMMMASPLVAFASPRLPADCYRV